MGVQHLTAIRSVRSDRSTNESAHRSDTALSLAWVESDVDVAGKPIVRRLSASALAASPPVRTSDTRIRRATSLIDSPHDRAAADHPLVADRARGSRVVRRVLSGPDPVPAFAAGGNRSLLYGQHHYRQVTQARLTPQDAALAGPQPYHTIDDYNGAIGINGLMTANQAAAGLFAVREALADPANWAAHIPGANAATIAASPELGLWIQKLSQNAASIGLEDLGDRAKVGRFGSRQRAGKKRINSNDRLTKNLGDPAAGHAANVNATQINEWLAPGKTFAQAVVAAAALPAARLAAINQFVYKAFFRRTSKLGIDFAIVDLGAQIHFNKAGPVNYHSPDALLNAPRADGLLLNDLNVDQSSNRSITVSELRHIKKRQATGQIGAGQVSFYNEY